MGNVQGYCKHVDDKDSTRHLIRINQLHDKYWSDFHVYDFQNNEIGKIENGKFKEVYSYYIRDIGNCYKFTHRGEWKIFSRDMFLETLKNAAVEHINKAIELTEEVLIKL